MHSRRRNERRELHKRPIGDNFRVVDRIERRTKAFEEAFPMTFIFNRSINDPFSMWMIQRAFSESRFLSKTFPFAIRCISGISGQRDPPFINPETGINYGKMLDNTPMQIQAPLHEIADVFRLKGILTAEGNRPGPVRFLINAPDEEIVKWYAALMHGMLSYYRPCDNFINVKRLCEYQIRWSAIMTIAQKHKSSSAKVVRQFTRDLIIYDPDGKTIVARLPDKFYIGALGRQFLPGIEKERVPRILRGASLIAEGKRIIRRCSVFGCTNLNVETDFAQHIPHFKKELLESTMIGSLVAMRNAIMRRPMRLCVEHWSELHKGRLRLEHLDYTMIMGRKRNAFYKDPMATQREYNWGHYKKDPVLDSLPK